MGFYVHSVMKDSDDLDGIRHWPVKDKVTAYVELAIPFSDIVAGGACPGIAGKVMKTLVQL